MFPQTHIHFTQRIFGRLSRALALGSIFPDMIINPELQHKEAHSLGTLLMNTFRKENDLRDFARGVVTHGIEPQGLDFFGDEQYLEYERGYCFEKARPLVDQTTRACNIPEHMGWWKAHNIVEMGIELHVSHDNRYGDIIRQACSDRDLIRCLGDNLPGGICPGMEFLDSRMSAFPRYIEIRKITPETLAKKYSAQMYTRHGVQINTLEVAKLISSATERISDDIEDFFYFAQQKILPHLDL